MENQVIIFIIISIIITSLVWYIYVTKLKGNYSNLQNNHENLNMNLDKEIIVKGDQNIKELQNKINELKHNLSETKQQSYLEGYDKARSEFTIKIFPYKKELKKGDSGWIINDLYHEVQVGYLYQLFLNGIPLLQPAIIIEETLKEEKKEIDYVKIEKVINIIESKLIPIVAESKGLMSYIAGPKK